MKVVSGGREQYDMEQDMLRERLGSAPGRVYIPTRKAPPVVSGRYWVALAFALALAGLALWR